jgi:hypothetical protein
MTDILLCLISFISFIFLVIGLGLSVRSHGQAGIISAMKQWFIGLSVVSGLCIWFIFYSFPPEAKGMFILLHMVLFGSLSFSYIIGLFGLPLTSLRIQLLLCIAKHGSSGINIKSLDQTYSKVTMVRQRLYRLETSREIIKEGKYYVLRSKWSYFVLHNMFLMLLLRLYRPLDKK